MRLYVRMRGGLGNQMYQYAYALALRERYPEAEIWLDTREYRTYKRRVFELTDFVLAENTFLFTDGKLRYDLPLSVYHIYQRLYREVRGRHPFGVNEMLARRGLLLTGLGCSLPRSPLPDETFLYGYFENAAVLAPIRGALRKAYTLPETAWSGIPEALREPGYNCAAVSIRLGQDIVKSGWQLCSREYYRDGIEAIRREHPVDRLLIFSDCPEQVAREKWFDDMGIPMTYTVGLSPSAQMAVMARCRDFVISNSTFAWWGSFLGSGENGLIVAPRLWQGNIPTEETTLYLSNMIIL